MTQYIYLVCILLSIGGVILLDQRFETGVLSSRLVRSMVVTVPLFLCFDVLGAARGWFESSPHLNSVIFPPGVPLEEPILLCFLALVSLSLWRASERLLR